MRHDFLCLIQQKLALVLPGFMDHAQQLQQTDHRAFGMFRKIRAGKEGLVIRCHKNAGGPAAASGKGLTERHIDAVNIRSFLLVHLDGDKVPIEKFRDFPIFKAFVRHHMTPMTGAVANTEENGLILLTGFLESLGTPGIPVHRIVCVLEQIGA